MTARLSIEVTGDGAAAAAALDKVAASATDMGAKVAAGGKEAGAGLAAVGDAADAAGGKAGAATGALGALSSGFELVGAEKYASGLQAAALATDFLDGAGQSLTLVTELLSLSKIKDTAATVAKAAAEKTAAAGTAVMTAGQWALNAALSANPVGLIVIALVALVAGIVLAYQKSETFREIVDKAFSVARAGVELLVDKLGAVVDLVRDKVGPIFEWLKDKIGDQIDAARNLIGDLIDKVKEIPGFVSDAADTIKSGFERAFAPIQTAIGWVKDLYDKLTSLKLPDWLPGGGGGGGGAAESVPIATTGGTTATATTSTTHVTIDLANGILTDPIAVARYLRDVLAREGYLVTGGVL